MRKRPTFLLVHALFILGLFFAKDPFIPQFLVSLRADILMYEIVFDTKLQSQNILHLLCILLQYHALQDNLELAKYLLNYSIKLGSELIMSTTWLTKNLLDNVSSRYKMSIRDRVGPFQSIINFLKFEFLINSLIS